MSGPFFDGAFFAGGFFSPLVVDEVVAGGGWLSDEQVRELQRLARRASQSRAGEWKRKQAEHSARLKLLRRVYNRTQGLKIDDDTTEDAAETLAEFAPSADPYRLPWDDEIDWGRLLETQWAVAQLANALAELVMERQLALDDEEDIAVLLLMV